MKKHDLIFIILFLAVLVVPTLIWTGARLIDPNAFEAQDASVMDEKRNKAGIKWDELLSSGNSINDWFQDRAPFRSAGIAWYQRLNSRLERGYEQNWLPALSEMVARRNEPSVTPGYTDGTLPFLDPLVGTAAEPESTQLTESLPPVTDEPVRPSESPAESSPGSTECPHEYLKTVVKEANCTENGLESYVCKLCGDSYETVTQALGHRKEMIESSEADFEHWGYKDYRCSVCGLVSREEVVPKKVDTSYLSPRVVGNGVIIGKYHWLFYTGNESVDYYKGSNLLTQEEMETYAEKVRTLQSLCDARGIRLCLFFSPNKEQVYREYMPSYTVENEYKRTQRLVDYLKENTQTLVLYPIEELREADLYHRTYYKYDTHWDFYGAFVGTMVMWKALGLEYTEPMSLSLEGEMREDGYFDLLTLGGLRDAGYPWEQEFCVSYRPDVTILSEESVENGNIYRCRTDHANGLKLAYFGDSFRIMQREFLVRSFSQVLIAHRDYINEYRKDEILDSDYLILSCVERTDARMFDAIDRLIAILGQ